jgi:protein-tyrosine-phosphatase
MARSPQAVLFMCGQNSVRSPTAACILRHLVPRGLYVQSAGVSKADLDPFAVAVMKEIGLDMSGHKPWTVEDLEDWEGLNFDLIVTLSPEAHHRALQYWPTPDPVGVEGRRELQLDAYRNVRDTLQKRIRERFGPATIKNE